MVHQVLLELQDLVVHPDPHELQVLVELQVQVVQAKLQEQVVHQVHLVLQVLLVHQEQLELVVQAKLQELQVQVEVQVHQEQ